MHQGYDTISAAMVWFLYLIAKHPEHQVFTTNEQILIISLISYFDLLL
jgi:hypothetical protein